jgi:3'(2'), 5'-bisphosphate nucleotidase
VSVALPSDAAVVARAAVLDAVIVCREASRRLATVGRLAKPDESPVTVADFAAQAVIVRRLRALGRPIVGEEQAAALREPANAALRDAVVTAVRPVWPDAEADAVLDAIDGAGGIADPHGGYWTVDPIDGTRGFVRGGQYAVCLAWIADGRPQLAVMGCPNLPRELDATMDVIDPEGTLFAAETGAPMQWGRAMPGAELHAAEPLSSEPLAMAAPGARGAARPRGPSPIVVTRSFEGTYSRLEDVERVLARLGTPIELRPADSQAKYGMVARGQAHAYLRIPRHESRAELVWDHAPGWMVATAAGVRVTDLAGEPLDFGCGERLERNYGVVCATPVVHAALIEAIAALGLQRPET